MKFQLVLIFLDCRYHQNAVQMVQKNGSHPWTEGPLRMKPIMREDRAAILRTEPIKLSKVASTLTAVTKKRRHLWTR